MFKKTKMTAAEVLDADRRITISYLRGASQEEYDKVLKIVAIKRKADFDVLVVELGSEKAAAQHQKAAWDTADADRALDCESEEDE